MYMCEFNQEKINATRGKESHPLDVGNIEMKAMCAWHFLFHVVNHCSTTAAAVSTHRRYFELGGRKSRACWSPRLLEFQPGPCTHLAAWVPPLHRVFHSLWVMLTIPGCKQRSTSDFFHHAQHPTTKPSRRPHESSHLCSERLPRPHRFLPPTTSTINSRDCFPNPSPQS